MVEQSFAQSQKSDEARKTSSWKWNIASTYKPLETCDEKFKRNAYGINFNF